MKIEKNVVVVKPIAIIKQPTAKTAKIIFGVTSNVSKKSNDIYPKNRLKQNGTTENQPNNRY